MSDVTFRVSGWDRASGPSWTTYVCRGVLQRTDDGEWEAYCTNLPGCVSEGATLEEAKKNLCEAFDALCQSYIDDGVPIPFGESAVEPREVHVSFSIPITKQSNTHQVP